jgi:hypothetical protein
MTAPRATRAFGLKPDAPAGALARHDRAPLWAKAARAVVAPLRAKLLAHALGRDQAFSPAEQAALVAAGLVLRIDRPRPGIILTLAGWAEVKRAGRAP